MKEVMPIKPQDVALAKLSSIPGDVIQCINEMLAKHWNGNFAQFKQDELVDLIIERTRGDSRLGPPADEVLRKKIHDNKWLDFEPLYEKFGWKVYYDRPAYNETYPATFKFTPSQAKHQWDN